MNLSSGGEGFYSRVTLKMWVQMHRARRHITGKFKRVIGSLYVARRQSVEEAPSSEVLAKIRESGLFDQEFYVRAYPELHSLAIDPWHHFVHMGLREQRQASEKFDPIRYLNYHQEVAAVAGNAIVDYVLRGMDPSLIPNAEVSTFQTSDRQLIIQQSLFDADYYRRQHPDLPAYADPLVHFLTYGAHHGFDPSSEFDGNFYTLRYRDARTSGMPPFLHYLRYGRAQGRASAPIFGMRREDLPYLEALLAASPLFDAEYYLAHAPVARHAHIKPELHYLISGHLDHLRPSEAFDPDFYLATNPDVRNAKANPLVHYLMYGQHDGRRPHSDRPHPTKWVSDAGWRDMLGGDIHYACFDGERYFGRFGFQFEDEMPHSAESCHEEALLQAAVRELCSTRPGFVSTGESVDASIIIPIYGQLTYVLSCLDALSRHRSRFTAEVIIVDDASPQHMQTQILGEIPWIRYERRSINGGFVENCNFGAGLSRGSTIIFLNSDTRVVDGWLDELIESFGCFPKAGMIGSKLFNADGSLQEAGGIYWNDGSAWNYGRNADPHHPRYSFARRVDYCSGASIAVRADVWREVNGFDLAYAPAYAEDADLAFKLRDKGYETWFQPLSRVIHYEGKSHGRDVTRGVKAYQVANMKRLAERWKRELSEHGTSGVRPHYEANRTAKRRILILDAVTPTPDRDSGSFITVLMIKALQELGWHILFVPQSSYRSDPTYTQDLQRIGVECLHMPYVASVQDVVQYEPEIDVVLGYRVGILDPVYEILRATLPAARIVFHNVDLHYLRELREAELQNDESKRFRALLTKGKELELIARVDCTIVHTSVEKALIQQEVPVSNILEFPYIAPLKRSDVDFAHRHDVMFLGGFGHPPNADAVDFFVREVWPHAAKHLPSEARFLIVGANPPDKIMRLADDRIIITGHVPDLVPYFEQSRVFVAPLRYGAGIKGKVVQSLAHGLPVAATSVAAEGMGLQNEEHAYIADDAQSLAASILHLYTNRDVWERMQTAGYDFVNQNYSWDKCLRLCQEFLSIADKTWTDRQESRRKRRIRELIDDHGKPNLPS